MTCSALLVSCDKISEITEEIRAEAKVLFNKGEEATGTSLSDEELAKSDAAVASYLDLLDKVPLAMAKVINEETALIARREIEQVAREISHLGMVLIDTGGENTEGEASSSPANANSTAFRWHVTEENKQGYQDRASQLARRIQLQLGRIERITKQSAIAFDLVKDAITILTAVENGGPVPGEHAEKILKPMPKDWLPPGVTRG